MNQPIEMKKIERRTYLRIFEDGLLDILLSCFLFGMGLSIVLGDLGLGIAEIWLLLIMPLLLIFGFATFLIGKKFITIPRMGYAKIAVKNKSGLIKINIGFLALGVFTFLASSYLISILQEVPFLTRSIIVSSIWVIVFMPFFGYLALTFHLKRFFFYGILYAASFPFRVLTKRIFDPFYISAFLFLVSAGIIFIMGLYLLARFLIKYPQAIESASYDLNSD